MGLPRLVEMWQALETNEFTSVRAENRLGDQAYTLEERLLFDPHGYFALQRLAATHPDPIVRDRAGVLLIPLRGFVGGDRLLVSDVRVYLAHPSIDLTTKVAPVPAIALADDGTRDGPDRNLFGADRSVSYEDAFQCTWVGGVPLGPLESWPRRPDGVPLAHVAQFDCRWALYYQGDLHESAKDFELPDTGVLQVFHDLETYGDEPTDRDLNAWQLRYVPTPAGRVAAPDDLEADAQRPQAIAAEYPWATLPNVFELDLTDDQTAAVLELEELLLEPMQRRSRDDPRGLQPIPYLFGTSRHDHGAGLERLATVRPEIASDQWRLLFTAPGAGPLAGWFHDEGSLELWIPHKALVDRDFAQAWALIRTD